MLGLRCTLGRVAALESLFARSPVGAGVAGSSRQFATIEQNEVAHISSSLTNTGLRAGPGGRSSVSGITATVFGATGFLGRYVVAALARQGTQVVCPYRCDDLDMQHLKLMGDLGQVVNLPDFSARDDAAVRRAISQSNVVINLIGSERETPRFRFQEVHVDIARRIAQAAADSGVCERLIHTSCLGASADAPSRRLQTKGEGDQAVRAAFPGATILHPAAITGVEDRFFNSYVRLMMNLPILPLVGGGAARVQPVYVRDVTEAFMEVLKTKDSIGRSYDLAGPRSFTRKQLVEMLYHTVREKYRAVPLPAAIARLLAKPREFLLGKGIAIPSITMYTEDTMLEAVADNVLSPSGHLTFADLGITPQRIDAGLPLEHVRHYRVGGYDLGTTSGTEEGVGSAPATN